MKSEINLEQKIVGKFNKEYFTWNCFVLIAVVVYLNVASDDEQILRRHFYIGIKLFYRLIGLAN